MDVLICLQLTVLWKLVEKVLAPRRSEPLSVANQSASQGMKWSFAPGTNLLSKLGAKIEKESRQKLNEFARELKSFPSIDMSGMEDILLYKRKGCSQLSDALHSKWN